MANTFKIGDIEVLVFSDGTARAPGTMYFPGTTQEQWAVHKRWLDHQGNVEFPFSCFLVRSGDRRVLIDTGLGQTPMFMFRGGALLGELAAAGVKPQDIDTVFVTHLHIDHCGTTVTPGADGAMRATFPNAAYRWTAAEHDYWSRPDGGMATGAATPDVKAYAAAMFAGVSDRYKPADDGEAIAPGVNVISTPGHTPGHAADHPLLRRTARLHPRRRHQLPRPAHRDRVVRHGRRRPEARPPLPGSRRPRDRIRRRPHDRRPLPRPHLRPRPDRRGSEVLGGHLGSHNDTPNTTAKEVSMSNPAETYESYMVPALFAPWAARLVAAAEPKPGQGILDLACGTGIVARLTAPRLGPNGKIIGFDVNPDMLAVARAAAQADSQSIEWRQGTAEALSFADASFDLVLCQFALMFFADRPTALAEVHRVLRDGGRVFLSVWQGLDRHPFYSKLHDVIEQHLGTSGIGEIFALGSSNELRTLLADAGFRHVEIEPVSMTARFPNPEGFLAGEIDVDTAAIPSMQRLDTRARQALTDAIRDEMAAPLRAITEGDHVVIPFHAHIASAHR